MGGTPHFTNNTDSLKEEAAALALMQTGLLAGYGLILAVVDNDAISDIAVVVRYSQIINALQFIRRRDFANWIPCMAVGSDSARVYRSADAYSIGIALVDNSAFDDGL